MKTITNNEKTLTSSQQIVFDSITNIINSKLETILKSTNIEDYLISLTGAAGTGKTYLTTQIAKHLGENTNHKFTVTAPTHKAASVLSNIFRENKIMVSAKTIHSFLGIKPFINYETGEEKFVIDKTKKSKENTSVLIVDESSMISTELYSHILDAIEDSRVELVLFIGDPYQLLPVDNSENQIYKLKNSFSLTEIVRQAKDSYIIRLATKLRERIKNKDFIELKDFLKQNMENEIELFYNKEDFIKDFYKNPLWYEEDKILATYKNKDVDSFNKIIRDKYWEQKGNQTPVTLLPGDRIRFIDAYSVQGITLYNNGQEIELSFAELKYHETLHINYWECKSTSDVRQQVFRVVDPDSMSVFNDKLNTIAKTAKSKRGFEASKLWKAFYATRDMFANVQYIHSSTIHKLQGSTYDVSYVDIFALADNHYMSLDEKYRLFYVAITRASKDIKIFISDLNQTLQDHIDINIEKEHQSIDMLLKHLNV